MNTQFYKHTTNAYSRAQRFKAFLGLKGTAVLRPAPTPFGNMHQNPENWENKN